MNECLGKLILDQTIFAQGGLFAFYINHKYLAFSVFLSWIFLRLVFHSLQFFPVLACISFGCIIPQFFSSQIPPMNPLEPQTIFLFGNSPY